MLDQITLTIWRQPDGKYAVTTYENSMPRLRDEGLNIKEALDTIETLVYMRFEAGVEP